MSPSPPPQDAPVAGLMHLEEGPPVESNSVVEEDSVEAEAPVILYPIRPEIGDKVGTITLPALDLSWPIYEGTTEDQLSLGVGHYVRSVLPGIRDNSVLSGHRTTVFGRLGELVVGDFLFVSTSAGEFTYQVREFRIVERTSRDVIVPTPKAVLTLTTCYPFTSVVPTTQAFIVSADLIYSRLN